MPARWAASTFSFTPPIGSTWPVRVISPVMATSSLTGRPERADTSAVAIVTPAEGPSLGTAPAGTWRWMSWVAKKSSGRSRPRSRPRARTNERAACGRLLHHVAELAGHGQPPAARHRHRLDEQDLAAGAGHREAGGHARLAGAALDLVVDALGAEDLAHHGRRRRPRGDASPSATRRAMRRAIAPRRRSSWRTPASRVYSRDHGAQARRRSPPASRRAARPPRSGAAAGSAGRCGASPPRCSPRGGSPPSGRAAGRGCVSSTFAVQRKSTRERSSGRSR